MGHQRGHGGADAADAFTRITNHSAFKAAVARGAHVLRMPRLFPQSLALEIASKRLLFTNARDGVIPQGSSVTPIRGLDRSRVNRWMHDIEATHDPVMSAIP